MPLKKYYTIEDINAAIPKKSLLIVLEVGNKPFVICLCKCGNIKEINMYKIIHGETLSCGCLLKNATHLFKHGLIKHPLYSVWNGIKRRCESVKNKDYMNYGGRGVRMCSEWVNNPENFIKWAQENGWKKGLQIDKDIIPKRLGIPPLLYSPEMCSIVTPKINSRTLRHNRLVEYNGETKTIAEWAEILNMPFWTIHSRLNKGKSAKEALTPYDKTKIMKAKEFVLSRYPNATAFPSIDNHRRQTSYVILKYGTYQQNVVSGNFEIFTNEGATNASKAWTNAKKEIIKEEAIR